MENIEKELSISDIFYGILKKWKAILACMLIFAVLFGGISYMKSGKSEGFDSLSENEVAKVETALAIQNKIRYLNEFIMNSSLMKLDPFSTYRAEISFYVDAPGAAMSMENADYSVAADAISAYILKLNNNGWKEEVLKATGSSMSVQEFNELVKLVNHNNSVLICVFFPTQEELRIISDYLVDYIDEIHKELTDTIGRHSLKFINNSIEVEVADENLSQIQQRQIEQLDNLEKMLKNKLDSFNTAQKAYFNDPQGYGTEQAIHKSLSVKKAIMGAILGLFLSVIVICLRFIFSDKLRRRDNPAAIFASPFLGCAVEDVKLNFIDRAIRRSELGRLKDMSRSEQIELICSKLRFYMGENNCSSLYISAEPELETMAEEIKEAVKSSGFNCEVGQSLRKNTVKLDSLKPQDSVMLLCKIDNSRCSELMEEIEIYKTRKINFAGIASEI